MKQLERGLEALIFASRWIQAPMFLGLIAASFLYAYRFMLELVALIPTIHERNEDLLLGVLGLVDMMMVANLIAMIVIGGYTLFVSKLNIGVTEDRPEWLDKTTAATLKIKLAVALVGVSGIHLLKTFIELGGEHGEHETIFHGDFADNMRIMWQVVIHIVFLLSSLLLSVGERIMHPPHHHPPAHEAHHTTAHASVDETHEDD